MAVSLIYPTPGSIALAKNPVIFKFRSLDGSDLYAPTGAQARLQAGGADKFAAGETFTVTYVEVDGTTESVIFEAVPTYTGELEIPDDTFSGTITQYWEAVRSKVAAHHRIAPFFLVTKTGPIGGNSIYLTAVNTDPAFEVTVDNTAGFTNSATAATADTTPDNYQVLLEVYVEQSYEGGDYHLAAQLENTPDVDGYMWFDISSILEAECRGSMDEPVVPVWGTDDIALADNLRRYYIRFTEQYGAPVVVQDWQYDDVRTIINGGVSQSLFAQGDFLSGLDVTDSLLTWLPDGRKIGLAQPEYLAWYNWDAERRAVVVEMQWYDINDNAISATAGFFTATWVEVSQVAVLPVNPTLLGLDAEPNAYKYRVRVAYLDDGMVLQPLSQWRTYFIDRDYFESERYVQYLNGFGVPDGCRCTGEYGKKLNVQRTVADKVLLPDYNEFATDSFQYAKSWENELTYRTGYLSRAEAETLQELLISGELYDVSAEGYIPLRIVTNSFQVTDTNQDLHAYQFAAIPRLDMRNYSKTRLTNLLSGAWQESGGAAWFDAALIAWET